MSMKLRARSVAGRREQIEQVVIDKTSLAGLVRLICGIEVFQMLRLALFKAITKPPHGAPRLESMPERSVHWIKIP